jgi:fused signal recognition particle receptor
LEEKMAGLFSRIKEGLAKTRDNILGSVGQVFKAFKAIDDSLFDELEEALILADLGAETASQIVDNLRKRAKEEKAKDSEDVRRLLAEEISAILTRGAEPVELPSPSVILIIGVNGAGKTTTIGKMTKWYKSEGKSVLIAAADTFRAAAIDQLAVWCERAGVTMIRHAENTDPAAVVFDAVQAAKARKTDLLIVDTAGRLHNKKNLMEELKKIFRIVSQQYPEAHHEVFLVLDATTGQNALSQAKLFKEAADITGIILTKLDGTAKGGVVVGIKNELDIPVRFITVGEGIDDLQPFDALMFARALFEAQGDE